MADVQTRKSSRHPVGLMTQHGRDTRHFRPGDALGAAADQRHTGKIGQQLVLRTHPA